jgi:hypothetical protein
VVASPGSQTKMKADSALQVVDVQARSTSACARSHLPWQWGADRAENLVMRPWTPCP